MPVCLSPDSAWCLKGDRDLAATTVTQITRFVRSNLAGQIRHRGGNSKSERVDISDPSRALDVSRPLCGVAGPGATS